MKSQRGLVERLPDAEECFGEEVGEEESTPGGESEEPRGGLLDKKRQRQSQRWFIVGRTPSTMSGRPPGPTFPRLCQVYSVRLVLADAWFNTVFVLVFHLLYDSKCLLCLIFKGNKAKMGAVFRLKWLCLKHLVFNGRPSEGGRRSSPRPSSRTW